jgi:hypothetical protein
MAGSEQHADRALRALAGAFKVVALSNADLARPGDRIITAA